MSRKTHTALAAIAATVSVTFLSAEGSGANAQQGENQEIEQVRLTEETVPQFVSEEVVQPLPEPAAIETDNSDSEFPSASSLRELVAEMPAEESLSREMECLAGAIYFESRGEPLAGQLAVGQVVINRAESRAFPASYCGVVYQRAQFSFIRNGTMPRIKRSSAAWRRAKAVARIAHEGLWESEAGDALFFHAKYVSPKWRHSKIARATIDTHIFYR